MQTRLTCLINRHRYSLVSMPDTSYDAYGRPGFVNAPQHSDSREGSPHGYPRNRSDGAPLLMLPAPIAVSPATGTPSGSSSLADAPYVRSADPSMNLSSYPLPSDIPGDSDREAMMPDSTSLGSGRTLVNMGVNAVMRAAPGQTIYPGETPNPYRSSHPQMVTYDPPVPQVASYGYAPEPTIDEYQHQQHQGYYTSSPAQQPQPIPSPLQLALPLPEQDRRHSRGVSLVDHGPVSTADTPVRRVANRQSKRQSGSHATPRHNQRNSGLFPSSPSTSPSPVNDLYAASPSPQPYFLPPGAAPPQPRGYHGPQ